MSTVSSPTACVVVPRWVRADSTAVPGLVTCRLFEGVSGEALEDAQELVRVAAAGVKASSRLRIPMAEAATGCLVDRGKKARWYLFSAGVA